MKLFYYLLIFGIITLEAHQPTSSKKELIQAVSANPKQNSLIALTESDLIDTSLDALLEPINFTQDGLHRFFKHIFNRKEYGIEVLPYSFGHLIQMIDFGTKTKQGPDYFKAVIKLFTIKTKSLRFVSSNEIERLINIVPDMLNKSLSKKNELKGAQQIKAIIMKELQATSLDNTEQFLNDLSNAVIHEINKPQERDVEKEVEQLRLMTYLFIDNLLNKILWTPSDHAVLWGSIERLAAQIAQLQRKNLFDHDEIDVLEWSLVHKFAHFIALAGAELPSSFYESARISMAKTLPGIDDTGEHDLATSKRQALQEILLEGHIQSEGAARLHIPA